MQRISPLLVLAWALAISACHRPSQPRATPDAEETRPLEAVLTTPPPVADAPSVKELVASLQRLSRVEETAPFIPFVTPRSKAWLIGRRIEDIRSMLAGDPKRIDCQEGRCIAWMQSPKEKALRPLVFLDRSVGWLWDPRASLAYREPNPGPSNPENRDLDPQDVFRSIPGNGRLIALLDTDVGTLRCLLDDRDLPGAVATFVGLATGLRAHQDPVTGEWVHRPCFDEQLLRQAPETNGLVFHCPAASEEMGPGFFKADEIRKGVGMDRPGRLAFASPHLNRVGGRVLLGLAPDAELDGLVTVLGQCGPKELLDRLAGTGASRPGAGARSIRLKGVSVAREESTPP